MSTRRSNLLFIYTDEQRFDMLAAYGNSSIAMPNLNRFAEQSVVFEKTYVTQPVCTPSRSSLLTGLYPHTNGCVANNVPLGSGTQCLPEMLPLGEYRCAHFGKWHLGNEIYAQHGFDDWRGTEDTYHRFYSAPHEEYADRSTYHHWLVSNGVVPESRRAAEAQLLEKPWMRERFFRDQLMNMPEDLSRPAFLAGQACEFLRENRNSPFVLYVNFLEPHMPFHSCRDAQYDPSLVNLPGNFLSPLTEKNALAARLAALKLANRKFEGEILNSEAAWRRLIARYWGMCSLVDTHAGKVLDCLSTLGLDNNTIIAFTSDHGDMMGSHELIAKGYMFEESTRVPLLLRLPGQNRQKLIRNPVSQIDIVPTLLDYMGERVPTTVQGHSLRGAIEDDASYRFGDVHIEWHDQAVAKSKVATPPPELPAYANHLGTPQQLASSETDPVRTVVTQEGWKYNWSTVGEDELFDLKSDPLELQNLRDEPSQKHRIEELRERIRKWQLKTGDPVRA